MNEKFVRKGTTYHQEQIAGLETLNRQLKEELELVKNNPAYPPQAVRTWEKSQALRIQANNRGIASHQAALRQLQAHPQA